MSEQLPHHDADLIELVGRTVRLEPLSCDHVDGLASAAAGERGSYGYTVVPEGSEATRAYVDHLLADRARGTCLPYVQVRLDRDRPEVVGCTRFMNFRRWTGRDAPDEVEIGGTWLSATAQRSGVNGEAKLLLLTHAFEVWRVWRVDFATDARNERSRVAIERLGATLEGVLRNHRPAADTGLRRPRDSAIYSITNDEWPNVAQRLRDRLAT